MTIILVDGVANVRDVGGLPAAGGVVRRGQLLRSGELSRISSAGASVMLPMVRNIVDLRSAEEVSAAPSALEGPAIAHLPLFLGSVASFFADDITMERMYQSLLIDSGSAIVSAIRVIAGGEGTLVHCTVGKDRTGIVVALALSAVGTDREAVIADYALTASQLPAERNAKIINFIKTHHPESVNAIQLATQSPEQVMRDMLAFVDERWGSAAAYLLANGLADAELAALNGILVEPVA